MAPGSSPSRMRAFVAAAILARRAEPARCVCPRSRSSGPILCALERSVGPPGLMPCEVAHMSRALDDLSLEGARLPTPNRKETHFKASGMQTSLEALKCGPRASVALRRPWAWLKRLQCPLRGVVPTPFAKCEGLRIPTARMEQRVDTLRGGKAMQCLRACWHAKAGRRNVSFPFRSALKVGPALTARKPVVQQHLRAYSHVCLATWDAVQACNIPIRCLRQNASKMQGDT